MLDVGRFHPGPDGDGIHHAGHAGQPADFSFRGDALELPIHLPGQGHPAVLHLHLDAIARHDRAPLQDTDDTAGDFIVGGLLVARIANFDFLGNGLHALDPFCGPLGGSLLGITGGMPAQSNDTVVRGHADMRCVHAGFEIQLVDDILLKSLVAHDQPPFHLVTFERMTSAPDRGIDPNHIARPPDRACSGGTANRGEN